VYKLEQITNVYFIGIGGIGMSALARYFATKGATVSGYDRARTPLTEALEKEGLTVYYEDSERAIDKAAQWVVYTPAIGSANGIMQFYRDHDYTLLKRSDVLERITAHSFNICIAGTHGKTTITTMTAHILRHSGYGCNAFLGGISVNYDTNFWSSDRNVCVVEADEYDRSFLKLSPDVAVITAMDPDHLDIYGTPTAMEDAFITFAEKVKPNGWLLTKYGLARETDFSIPHQQTYGLHTEKATVHTERLRIGEGSYTFDVSMKDTVLTDVTLHMGGTHNVENALAAIAVAHSLDIPGDAIRLAVADFKGVKRRFEYIIRNRDWVMVDDYAHHPEELRALISGAKDLFPDRLTTVVFQPHLFSRTKDLARAFASSLDLADDVILLPIYPARESPVEGVSSALIEGHMTNPHRRLMTKEQLLRWAEDGAFLSDGVPSTAPRLLIMAGAGDIDALVSEVSNKIKSST
jgi:UDP-N-acetylmuramate--alanine ligase